MKNKAFTLIELLIVVAIIAILAAIAVPNFLEAQTRSKVSRVKADQRSLATALETYYVDNNKYPPNDAGGPLSQFRMNKVVMLTTPIAYMTSLPKDPFLPGDNVGGTAALDAFQYFNYDQSQDSPGLKNMYGTQLITQSWGFLVRADAIAFDIKGGCIKSWGPDAGKPSAAPVSNGDSGAEWSAFGLQEVKDGLAGVDRFYDPTNGTVSAGDIPRYIGAVKLPQVPN